MTGATLTKKFAGTTVNLSFAGCGFLGVYQGRHLSETREYWGLSSGGSGGGIPSAFPDSGGVQGWWKQCWRSGCRCHAHWPTNAIRNGTGGRPQGIILTFVMLWVQFEEMMAEASKHRLGAFSPYFHLGSAIEVILRILSTARSSLYSIIQNRPLCTPSYPLTLTLPSLAASMCLSPTFPVDPSPTPLSLNSRRGWEVK